MSYSGTTGSYLLTLTVDPTYLAKATYPVYVDPTLDDFPQSGANAIDTMAAQKYPNSNFNTYVRPDSPYYAEMWLGKDPVYNTYNHDYIWFKNLDTILATAHIEKAQLKFYPYWQYYHYQARPTWLRLVTGTWQAGQVTWNNQPSVESTDYMQFDTTEAHWSNADLTPWLQDVVNGQQANYGFMLHADGTGQGNWKRIVSLNDDDPANLQPYLHVEWHRPAATPTTPLDNSWNARTLTWSYDAGATGQYATPQSHYWVQAATDTTFTSAAIVRETTDGASGKWAAGSAISWTFPETGTTMTEGSTYYWRVKVKDGFGESNWSAVAAFRLDTTPPSADFTNPDEGTTTSQSATSVTVSWTEHGTGSTVATRSLQRQSGNVITTGSCDDVTWADDGSPATGDSPVVESGLVDGYCYRWVLSLTDAAGNDANATSGAVLIDTTLVLPTIEIAAPLPGSTIFASQAIAASLSDPSSVLAVDFLVDGAVVGTSTQDPWSIEWDTTTVADGSHDIGASATLAGGATVIADAIDVTVSNALPGDKRLDADYAAGLIDADTYAVDGVYALGAPDALPDRYRSSSKTSADTSALGRFLSSWDTLSQQSRDEIEAFLNQPERGIGYVASLSPDVQIAVPPYATNDTCVTVIAGFILPLLPISYALECTHHVGSLATITYYIQAERSGVPDTGEFADDVLFDTTDASPQNGVPDYIDTIQEGFLDAWVVYVNTLQYPAPQAAVQITVDGVGRAKTLPKYYVGGPATIEMDRNDGTPLTTIHHELFHVFQWPYLVPLEMGINYAIKIGPWWWLEASAQWAAAYVSSWGFPDESGAYARTLPDYLGRPDEPIDHLDGDAGNRQYGEFVLAEYLVGHLLHDAGGNPVYDAGIIRETWDATRNGAFCIPACIQDITAALETVAANHGTALSTVIPAFAGANYLLGYTGFSEGVGSGPTGVPIWRSVLGGPQSPTTNGDDVGPARPMRHRNGSGATEWQAPSTIDIGRLVSGEIDLVRGGTSYIDLVPTVGVHGSFHVTFSTTGGPSNVQVMAIDYSNLALPTVCGSYSRNVDSNGSGSIDIDMSTCRYAVLILTANHVNLFAQSTHFIWTAALRGPWTEQASPFAATNPNTWSIAYGDGLFVAGADTGYGSAAQIATSPDGMAWTPRGDGGFGEGEITDIAYGNGLWVAIGTTYGSNMSRLATSPDGIMWTERPTPFGTGIYATAVAYGDGTWVVSGLGGHLASTSDPVSGSWTSRASGFGTTPINDVAFADGKWLAVGWTESGAGAGTKYAVSTDAASWSEATFPGSTQYTGASAIAYGHGEWVVLAYNGSWSSSDAQSWVLETTGVGGGLDVAYGDGLFVVVGVDCYIWSSTDGQDFTEMDNGGFWTNPLWDLLAVAYGNGTFAAAGGVAEYGSMTVAQAGP